MGNKKRINTYDELVSYYEIQVKRLDEIDDLLDDLDGKIKPSLVKRRKDLEKLRRELYGEIDRLRDFVMDTLTFDEKTFVSLITRFYSFYTGQHLKPVKIKDRKVSFFCPAPAFLIVSDRDYDMIMNNFNTNKPINSDKILDACEDDYLYFVGDEVYELASGVHLSTEYEAFSEMDGVLCNAVTCRIQNNKMSAVECLECSFNEYVKTNTDPFENEQEEKGQPARRYKTSFVETQDDPDIFAQIGQEVQKIMEEEKDKGSIIGDLLGMFMPDRTGDNEDAVEDDYENVASAASNGDGTVTIDTSVSTIVVKPARDGQQVVQSGQGRVAEIMEASRQRMAAVQQQTEVPQSKGKVAEIMNASRQRMAAMQTQGTQATSTSSALFAMLGVQVEMQQQGQQPQVISQKKRGVKVVSSEAAQPEKQTQYAATSSVLLNMLNGTPNKQINDEEKRKKKVKKY